MMDDEKFDTFFGRTPAQYEILAEGPQFMEESVELNQVAALAQVKLLIETNECRGRNIFE